MNLVIFSLIISVLIVASMIGISMIAFKVAVSTLVKINQLEEDLTDLKSKVNSKPKGSTK